MNKYVVEVKGIKRQMTAKKAIDYFKELTGPKTKITWQLVRALDMIQCGDFKLYYQVV